MNAPDFSLPDQNGKVHTLSEYTGRWLVVFFYPKDDTPGCTKEACGFRDLGGEFAERNIAVIGISKDTIHSHKKFADKHHLPFILLSDVEGKTVEAFGAWGVKKFMGREFTGILRNTYLISPKEEIVKTYERVNPLTHPNNILGDIKALQ